ncbi:hypothetical protein F2Q68_00007007 [Brassica cretica]|uniref:Uncharacterized protein n=1 Tax=Brassica cretica TaxID=69181 RepID=A0A8S9KPU6_BRACR|nr:hypothetical protein F2Q68_00007007 [Brassica cretica]
MGIYSLITGRRGPSGFGSASTAEEVTKGIDATHLTAIITEGPDNVSASSTSYASGGTTAGAAADSDSAGGSGTASGVAYSVAEGSTGEP